MEDGGGGRCCARDERSGVFSDPQQRRDDGGCGARGDGSARVRDAGSGGAGRQEGGAGLSRIHRADRSDPQHLIHPRISGYIQKQDTLDGADVREGDLLYTIDPRDVQAALDQVKAQTLRDKAALEYARSNLNRGAALVANGFLAKDTYDQRASAQGQAEAVLAMDEAAMRTAELNLSYTQVRAPFPDGSAAIRLRSERSSVPAGRRSTPWCS